MPDSHSRNENSQSRPARRLGVMALLLLVILSGPGCGTVVAAQVRGGYVSPYQGVQADLHMLSSSWGKIDGVDWKRVIWMIFDLPLSFVADTVLFPFILLGGSLDWN